MNKEELNKEILYELFRYHQYVIGTTDTSIVSLHSFITALRELKCTKDKIRDQVNDLFETIKNSRPKLVILNNAIRLCEKEIAENNIFYCDDVDRIKADLIDCIEKYLKVLNDNIDDVVSYGVKHVENGDCIIVHSVNEPVQRIIPRAKRLGKKFKVLILRQDKRKTKQIMRYMSKEKIDFLVAPEHELSHFVSEANKLFIGAVAVTGDDKIVCAAGTSNIASIAKRYHLPIYLFIHSLKFSHLTSEEHNINRKERLRYHDDIKYFEISYSHDLVDLKVIDHVFTEKGEIGDKEIDDYHTSSTIKTLLDS